MKTQTIGSQRHLIRLQRPLPATPDGDGGAVQTWTDLTPALWRCSIAAPIARDLRDLERLTAGTVLSTATYVIKGRYHPGLTTLCRGIFRDRTLQFTSVINHEERNRETHALAVEVVT